jgi:NAD(P)-dependent dehydrogenase (short-subunit alcohol dehydrogenase family)
MARLAGKTALVTGGGSGIGLATTRLLLAEGATVAISGRDAEKLRRAAAELGAGDRVIHHAADLSRPDQAQSLADVVTRRLGRIDMLINNAGGNVKERQFRQLTPESYDLLMGGNLHGAFLITRALLPQMLGRRDGTIVFVNSVAGKRAGPLGGAAYAAAKFGLRGLAMALAAEEKGSGVRVSSIYPGEVDTPILEHRPAPVTDEHRRSILRPEDVAAAVLFVVTLPPHVVVPELVMTPAVQMFI